MKVTYKADKRSNKVLRIIDDKDPDIVTGCTILDENNWVCPGGYPNESYNKQYAVNGIANWNDSPPSDFNKKYGYQYSCRYEKNIFGSLRVIEQKRKY